MFGGAGLMSAAQAQTKPTEQAHAQQAPLKAPDTMAERVRGCTACHGVHGQGTDNDYFRVLPASRPSTCTTSSSTSVTAGASTRR